ncbi:MAG TPA: class F sortase [Propionibacteriaceae bacterium]|nr:class F sortase [Propionibacteriaceae bacterium]
MPSVDVAMKVLPVGVEDDGDMELPSSVFDAGWYKFGSRPADQAGSTLIAAHVDSRADGLGPFARLRRLEPGAKVLLTTQDGIVHHYRVVSVRAVAKDQLSSLAVFERNGPPRVTLLTCGGSYDSDTGYRDNVVVTAMPESAAKS